MIAEIPLGDTSKTPYPNEVAVTPDSTRAYVTLEGSGQVAVVDAMTLQEIDVHAAAEAASTPSKAPILASGGAALDPALRLAEISGPTAIRGTVNMPNLDHWTLELAKWDVTYTPILTLGSDSKTEDSATLATFDPAGSNITNGFYRLRLTAYDKDGNTSIDEIYVGVDANPRSEEIDLPIGAEPDGITIDPSGNYAYVSDARPYLVDQHSTNGTSYVSSQQVSQIYLIDINPASPTYDQLVETIQLITSAPLSDGTQPSVADPNGLIAPDGLREIAVTPDGSQVDVAAPDENSNPNGGPFDDLNGNLIQINLTPQANFQPPKVKNVVAIPAADGTFGVAIEPQAMAAQAAAQSGQPVQYDVAFTNDHTDNFGIEVDHAAAGNKNNIPLDLDPYDLDSTNPLNQYAQANSQYQNAQWLQVHNAGGIAITADGQYAFVAGRADQVTSVVGGGYDGEDEIASAITGYLDQDMNPLYEDGNVAIIKNPFGNLNDPNPALRPMLVGATRPIPYGFPVDLALSPPDANGQQFLYVSYQGLPTANIPNGDTSQAVYGSGAVFVFNATAMINQVKAFSQTPGGSLILAQVPIDDIVGTLSSAKRAPNTTIDVRADYRLNYQTTDPKDPDDPTIPIFGVFDDQSFAPIALGGYPGGIAISNPVPHPVVYQHVADEGGSGTPGASLLLGVDLTPTNKIVFAATDVDPVTGNVMTDDGDFYFSVDMTSKVTLYLKGDPTATDPSAPAPIDGPGNIVQNVPDPLDPTKTLAQFKDVILSPGVYHTVITAADNLDPRFSIYTYSLVATAYDPDTGQSGNTATNQGTIVNQLADYNAAPIAHNIIDGVDIWDGHLTVSATDINVSGRGPDLNFARTYTNNSDVTDGPLGAGWTDYYQSTLTQNDDGTYTVVANGTGNTFTGPGKTNPTQAALFGVPADLMDSVSSSSRRLDTIPCCSSPIQANPCSNISRLITRCFTSCSSP